MAEVAETEEEGLTSLDLVVIVAASVALLLLAWWAYQGKRKPQDPPTT